MRLFRRHRDDPADDLPSPAGLAEFARAHGWEVAGERPFDGHLEEGVHRVTLAIHRVPSNTAQAGIRVGLTVFRDSYRTSINGRTVVVSNGWTNIQTEIQHAPDHWRGVAVCAAEMPSLLGLASVHPTSLRGAVGGPTVTTGNPAFDQRFVAVGAPDDTPALLTPQVQQRIIARDDWTFWIERYLFGCITPGAFESIDEIRGRIDEVLGIIDAIPTSVLPDHIDHSADDLIAQISRLTSLEEALAWLQRSRRQNANSSRIPTRPLPLSRTCGRQRRPSRG